MTSYAWLLPALPLLAAVAGLGARRRAELPAVAGGAAALVVAVALLASVAGAPSAVHEATTTWTPIGSVTLDVGTRVDGLAAVVSVMVAVVALLVQLYSIAYMHGDRRYPTYAAEVSLFTAAMLLVVVSSDLFELVVGWEVMGICSYLLIGHYWHTPTACGAANKAFLVTRIGDVGFLFGIFALGVGAGSFSVSVVTERAATLPHGVVLAGALLLLCGVVGKSAQFPLHVWLPDAMAGPTPISALIHAATMVAAGVYVVARLYPVYVAAPVALDALGVIAAVTMLFAALAALAQDDLKRVLAWSTCSQLAYMAGGLAVGGWTAGIYHLLTHAAFKALLFLGAGSVIRSVGTNLMSEMGGLGRRMPLTFVTTLVGALALAGIPPFAGAFSKDAVLSAAFDAAAHGAGVGTARWVALTVYASGLATVVVTGAYVTRLVVRTFLGEHRGSARVHESPAVMTGPLVVLAVAAVGLGAPVLPSGWGVARWLPVPPLSTPLDVSWGGVGVGAALAVAGVLAAAAAWRLSPADDPARVLGRVAPVLERGFAVDALYDRAVVRPAGALARLAWATDRRGVDEVVEGSAGAVGVAGRAVGLLQRGNVQAYATGLLAAVVVIVVSVAVAR